MSVQRRGRNAQRAEFYPTISVTDERGNEQQRIDYENGSVEKVSATRAKSAELGVPGQVPVEVCVLTVRPEADPSAWSVVAWNGALWDISSPARFHHGTRHVRHWSVEVRKRPS